jgi:hypothetical protein
LPVELLQKPVSNKVLIETIEDSTIYEELSNLKFDFETIRKAEFRHEQLKRFYIFLKLSLTKGNQTMATPGLRQAIGAPYYLSEES